MHRRMMAIGLAAVAVVGSVSGVTLGWASREGGCERQPSRAFTERSQVARGAGLSAALGRSIVTIGSGATETVDVPVPNGVVRHVATRSGIGTAFIDDLRGPDVVVIATSRGVIRLPQPGEAAQPAWSSTGDLAWSMGSYLRLRGKDGVMATIDGPEGGLAVFSPTFTSATEITAVVSEPVRGVARTEDDALNDLWRYDTSRSTWTRITHFAAAAGRWSVIRTPVTAPDGSLEFVRVQGSASTTMRPSFELWRLVGGVATKVRTLPGEMYLAGYVGGQRVWNIYDGASGDWRLYREDVGGGLTDLGCGAVMVDPLATPDPDRANIGSRSGSVSQTPAPTPTPSSTPTPTPTPTPSATASPSASESATPSTTPSPMGLASGVSAVLVGDFGDLQTAQQAAADITQVYGTTVDVEVIDSSVAPNAVQPGVWAVVVPLATDADPLAALMEFRTRMPQFASWSWIVSI